MVTNSAVNWTFHKLLQSAVLVALLAVSAVNGQTFYNNNSEARFSAQPQNTQSVFEPVRIAALGPDRTYALSFLPSQQHPVHVFDNGLELVAGEDYILRGQMLTLHSNVPVSESTVIQVSYAIETTSTPVDLTIHAAIDEPSRAVLTHLLARALARELSSSPEEASATAIPTSSFEPSETSTRSATSMRPALSAPVGTMPAVSPTHESGYRSIRMLSSILDTASDEKAHDKNSVDRGSRYGIAGGADGLGDGLLSNQFSTLLFSNSESAAERGIPVAHVSHSEDSKSTVERSTRLPRSLKMLRQQLLQPRSR